MRQILSETQWQVTLTTAGPQIQTLQKQVEAPTQDTAIRRAIQSFPGMQFSSVTATALQPQPQPGQNPLNPQQQLPRQPGGLRQLQPLMMPGQQRQAQQQTESHIDVRGFRFPYALVLPASLSQVLNEAAPVPVTERSGQHHAIIRNEAQMATLLKRLNSHPDRRAAQTILAGIRSSIA
jgi:hypothetical protein